MGSGRIDQSIGLHPANRRLEERLSVVDRLPVQICVHNTEGGPTTVSNLIMLVERVISKSLACRSEQRRRTSPNTAASPGRFLDYARNDVPLIWILRSRYCIKNEL
jgi:hypothetical protein